MQQVTPLFKHHKLEGLDFQLQAQTTSEGRIYTTPEGNIYPSASSVAKYLNRDAIAAWRARVGEAEANRKTKRGADRGSDVHFLCEKYMLNTLTLEDKLRAMPHTKSLFLQAKKSLDKSVKLVYAIEQAVYSHRLRLAGRLDGLVLWENDIAILDFKTSAKPKPEEWILNYFVQCAAYAEMVEERTGVQVNKIVILMVCEEDTVPTIYIKDKASYLPVLQKCIDQYYAEHS